MTTLSRLKRIIEEDNVILEQIDGEQGGITIYRFIDKATEEENGHIQLTICNECPIARYNTKNQWHTPSRTFYHKAISVNFLRSEKKGMGKLLLGYGVLAMHKKFPKINYSVLDDASDLSNYRENNIYTKFGYSPTTAAKLDGNRVILSGGEKQVHINVFEQKVRQYLLNEPVRYITRSSNMYLKERNTHKMYKDPIFAVSHNKSLSRRESRSRSRSRSRNRSRNSKAENKSI
jgi:hypothetical protein